MSDFKVEKGIPAPSEETNYRKYPLSEMAVGDSFCFPSEMMRQVRCAAHNYGKRKDIRFTTRKVDKQTGRCWRIK